MHFQGRTVSIYWHSIGMVWQHFKFQVRQRFCTKTDEHLPYLFIHDKENCHMNQCFNWFAGGTFCLLDGTEGEKNVQGDSRFAVRLMDRDRLRLAKNVSCQIRSGDCEIL